MDANGTIHYAIYKQALHDGGVDETMLMLINTHMSDLTSNARVQQCPIQIGNYYIYGFTKYGMVRFNHARHSTVHCIGSLPYL